MKYIATNIKKIRKVWRMNQSQFGLELGLNRGKIMSYETVTVAPIPVLVQIEEKTGIPIYAIVTREILKTEIPIAPMLKEEYEKLSIVSEPKADYDVNEDLREVIKAMLKRIEELENTVNNMKSKDK